MADPAVVHSSIALLQERFRQLQKVKEMREEREVLRLLSLSDPKKLSLFNTYMFYDPALASFFSHPELMLTMLPERPPPQTSLSLWPASHSQSQSPSQGKKHAENYYYRAGVGVDIPPLMNLWPPTDTTNTSDSATSLYKLDDDDDDSDSDTDIDTSLHL